jgi:hypothetical protein
MNRMVTKLVTAYAQATSSEREAGVKWYQEQRVKVSSMAKAYGVSKATAAGVVAALSPRLRWSVNVRAAETLLSGESPSGVFKASRTKAQRIKAGEKPLRVLSGPKVRAFYRALMGDDSAAVVDVWVARAVGWTKEIKAKAYLRIASALAKAASIVGEAVVKLQAVAWVVVRGSAT